LKKVSIGFLKKPEWKQIARSNLRLYK